MGKPLKAALRALLVLAIAAALVVAVFAAGPDAIASALTALDPAYLAWASLAFMSALFMGATPAGLGFVETAMIGILAMYRISGDKAMAATLVSRIVNLVLSLGIGGAITLVLTAIYGKIPEKNVREAKIAAGAEDAAEGEDRGEPGENGEGAL